MFVVVQSLSHDQLFATPQTDTHQVSLSFTISWRLLKFMSIESVITIHPSHPLSSPSPPAFNLSQHQGFFPVSQFFKSSGQSIGALASASVIPINIQDQFPLRLTSLIPLLSKGLSRVFSSITVQKHQFFGTQPSLWSNSHILTRLLEK